MGNLFSADFQEFLDCLNKEGVEYILVGGFAVILHGYERVTGDMDIWVNRTEANYKHIEKAFQRFGMPVFDMTLDNFLFSPDTDVFRFGRRPNAIDIMVKVKGLEFSECWTAVKWFEEDGLKVPVLHLNQLIAAKKASGRFKDLDDIEQLTK